MNRRHAAATIVRVVVAAVTLYLVFQSVSWASVVRAFADADALALAGGVLLLGANLWVRGAKWRYMLRAGNPDTPSRDAFWSLLLGISLGAVTPGEVGEFAGRSLHVTGPARAHLVGLAVLDRLHIFLIWIAFGVPSLVFLFGKSSGVQIGWSAGAVLLALAVFLHLDVLRRIGDRLNSRFLQRPWLEHLLDGFGCLNAAQRRITLFYTIAFHLVLCLQMHLFLNAFHSVTMLQSLAGTSALMFVKALLPISLGDLGIRELTSVYLFGWFGVPQADAVNASLLLFVVNVVLPGLVGVLALRKRRPVPSEQA